ncbi:M10 family metallopeptidase [Kordiimonas pumila]|uniref:M10 family metallopeptidase n=1 Tax=Kordiimonas pumila TaxID=2161677 RepID=A0ABV7D3Q6_9PROT|nr:M10 family metallopeptidase [Kordiimonas pumila]
MLTTGYEQTVQTVSYGPTGNDDVDALLYGRSYAPDEDGHYTLSFSFPSADSLYSSSPIRGYGESDAEPYYNLTGVSAYTQSLFVGITEQIEAFTNLDLVEVEDEGELAGTIRLAWTSEPDEESVAWAYLPGNNYVSSDIWLQADNSDEDDIDFAHTLLHELGHALGLKHSFEEDGDFPAISSEYEGVDYTVMSYDVSGRFPEAQWADLWPQTYMYFDILALQAAYGVDTVTTASADTYDFSLSERYYMTVWDYSGTDSFGVSSGSTDVYLNLTPGSWSNVGTTIEYWDGSGYFYDSQTVYIADDTVIEQAYGASGDDTLQGNDVANLLIGNAGDDILSGGAGDDVLRGNAGDDISYGGAGDDAVWAGTGDAGDDFGSGGAGNDTLGGGAGDDFLIGGGFDDGNSEHYAGASSSSTDDGSDDIFGGDGNDTLIGGGWDDSAVNDNGIFNAGEEITSGTGQDAIWAGAGDDLVYGAAGSDALGGGLGNDTLYAAGGNDTLYGGKQDGRDSVDGGSGNDEIYTGAGNDTISGGSGNDNLFSGAGNDTVDGGSGNDTLWGGGGNDRFTGGAGADTFIFEAGHGDDIITDFSEASDILDLSSTVTDFINAADVQAAATNSGSNVVIDLGGGDSLTLYGFSVSDLDGITYVL